MKLLVWLVSTPAKRKVFSAFWVNVAVAWFVVVFIGDNPLLTRLFASANMLAALLLAAFFAEK